LTVAAGLLVGGGWFFLNDASAVAAAVECDGSKDHMIGLNGGTPVLAETDGGILVLPGNPGVTPDGRTTLPLTVTDVFSKGTVEGLGELTISLDRSKPAPAGALTANQKGAAFPATQVVQFYPSFDLNGETFQTQAPARVMNSNVKSFPPAPGTVYVLTNEMELKSAAGNTMKIPPGKAFTVR
jgi:hypothetical protein